VSLLSRKIGIDLGSSTVRIYVKGEGIVVNEPSGVATLLRLIGKAGGRPRLFRPDVVVSVRSGVTSRERREMTEVAMSVPVLRALTVALSVAGLSSGMSPW